MQPLLIGRAEPIGGSLLHVARIEGVPPLMFVLTKVTDWLFRPPVSLALVGVAGYLVLLVGTSKTLEFLSGNQRWSALLTVLLGMTYLYSYEFGIVVRQYGLGLGFALLAFAYLGRSLIRSSPRNGRIGALFASLAALTSAHPACLAGGALVGHSLVGFFRTRSLRAFHPALLSVPSFLFLFWIISPHPERANMSPRLPDSAAMVLDQCESKLELALREGGRWAIAMPTAQNMISTIATAGVVAGLLLMLCLLLVERATFSYALIALVINSATVTFILCYYDGGPRHRAFLVVPLVLFIAGATVRAFGRAVLSPLAAATALMFIPWFAAQISFAVNAIARDDQEVFSSTRAAGKLIPSGAAIVADTDLLIGVLYWSPRSRLWTPTSNGRELKYIRADNQWNVGVAFDNAVESACATGQASIYLAAAGTPDARVVSCGTNLLSRGTSLEEAVELWQFPCSCLMAARR